MSEDRTINGRDLIERGWPQGRSIGLALRAAGRLSSERAISEKASLLARLEGVREDPDGALAADPEVLGELAREFTRLRDSREPAGEALRQEPLPYEVWGSRGIDEATRTQMETALRLPVAAGGALMADGHLGYGLPVGGVLATRGAVIPWAVGVDIACRLRLSVFDLSPEMLDRREDGLVRSLEEHTVFGTGAGQDGHSGHEVLDDPAWEATDFLKGLKDTAHEQLGTSGSGNHFVEWGAFEVPEDLPADGSGTVTPLAPGSRYLALLSHSGSRGMGFKVAGLYSEAAAARHPELDGEAVSLAWLDLSSEEGEEYWLSMQLAGRYAAANHAVIHDRLCRFLGEEAALATDHHHNYAWRESWHYEEVVVHRKGATPAGEGVLGIIPGTMADAGYLTLGRGSEASLNSAAHGAGRVTSRTQAFKTLDERAWRASLEERGVTLIGGSLDESPAAYKDITSVMALQDDLVEVLGRFVPTIVRMDVGKPRGKSKRSSG